VLNFLLLPSSVTGMIAFRDSWLEFSGSYQGSTALALIGPRRVEARGSWLLQGALLGEVSRLATGVAATSLATGVGVGRVAVTT
jgi:hypothetical protein